MATVTPDHFISDVCGDSHQVIPFPDPLIMDPLFPPLFGSGAQAEESANIFDELKLDSQGDIIEDLIEDLSEGLTFEQRVLLNSMKSSTEAMSEGPIPSPPPTPEVPSKSSSQQANPCTPKKSDSIPLG